MVPVWSGEAGAAKYRAGCRKLFSVETTNRNAHSLLDSRAKKPIESANSLFPHAFEAAIKVSATASHGSRTVTKWVQKNLSRRKSE